MSNVNGVDVLLKNRGRFTASVLYECACVLKSKGQDWEAYALALEAVLEYPQFGYPSEDAFDICARWAAKTFENGDPKSWRQWRLVYAAFASKDREDISQLPIDVTADERRDAQNLQSWFAERYDPNAPMLTEREGREELQAVFTLLGAITGAQPTPDKRADELPESSFSYFLRLGGALWRSTTFKLSIPGLPLSIDVKALLEALKRGGKRPSA